MIRRSCRNYGLAAAVVCAIVVVLIAVVSTTTTRSRRREAHHENANTVATSVPPQHDNTTQATSSEEDGVVLCSFVLFDILKGFGEDGLSQSDDYFVCNAVVANDDGTEGRDVDERNLVVEDVPQHLRDLYQVHLHRQRQRQVQGDEFAEDFWVAIPGGVIDWELAVVRVPRPMDMYIVQDAAAAAAVDSASRNHRRQESSLSPAIVPPTRRRHGRRRLASTSGTLSAVGVRISFEDAEPTFSANHFRNLLFEDAISFKNQMSHCSAGHLKINPAQVAVLDIKLPGVRSGGITHEAAVNKAHDIALKKLKNKGVSSASTLRNYADLILYMLPPMGSWVAYASIGGGTSVYNDKWAGYMASQMHEVGHNLGLMHAYKEGVEYQDRTGPMGGAMVGYHDREHFPEVCYNAGNNWQLGWYTGFQKTLDPNKPEVIKLAAFVDYDVAQPGTDILVAQTGNTYMQYNRAAGPNKDTYEFKDHLVITVQLQEGGTDVLAALDAQQTTMYQKQDGPNTWTVQVCSQHVSRNANTPDYLMVSVGYGASLCGKQQQQQQPNQQQVVHVPPYVAPKQQCTKKYSSCRTHSECCTGYCRPFGTTWKLCTSKNFRRLKQKEGTGTTDAFPAAAAGKQQVSARSTPRRERKTQDHRRLRSGY